MTENHGLPRTFRAAADRGIAAAARLWLDLFTRTEEPDTEALLADLAVSSLLMDRLGGWRGLTIHNAVLSGASVEQVTAALVQRDGAPGATAQTARVWHRWAADQLHLRETDDLLGLDRAEYERVLAVLGPHLTCPRHNPNWRGRCEDCGQGAEQHEEIR